MSVPILETLSAERCSELVPPHKGSGVKVGARLQGQVGGFTAVIHFRLSMNSRVGYPVCENLGYATYSVMGRGCFNSGQFCL